MKQAYRTFRFKPATLALIHRVNGIIDTYRAQGFTLSVRQIYYQLVAADEIENTEQSYKNVASVLNDGRLAGMIDWDAIEDRNRDIELRQRWESGAAIAEAAVNSFHMDMWVNQPQRVFVIVEKAALAGVLGGVCRQYDVPLLAARGYPSVSIVREMVEQHLLEPAYHGQQCIVLHLGDHDPSGIDMTRDLQDRIAMFAEGESDKIEVQRIALTMDQIREKNPPPNPAKMTDARFSGYRAVYGSQSWELDALQPAYLVDLVSTMIENNRDQDAWHEREQEVEDIRAKLATMAKALKQ